MLRRTFYFKSHTPDVHGINSSFPILVYHMPSRVPGENRHVYSVPIAKYPGMVKVCVALILLIMLITLLTVSDPTDSNNIPNTLANPSV